MAADLEVVFAQLKSMLKRHARGFHVTDRRGFYALDDWSVRGHDVSFAAVVAKRGRVSFYLLPTVYTPALMDGVSRELRATRTAAGFFNFKAIEPKLFTELDQLVRTARKQWDPRAVTG